MRHAFNLNSGLLVYISILFHNCYSCSSSTNKNEADPWKAGDFKEDCDVPTLPNVGYAFRGYNIFIGNPFHADTHGDPGFKLPIFKASQYGRTNADMSYRLPDGLFGYKKQICKLDSQSKEISNEKSYQDDLLVKVDLSLDAGDMSPVSFTANSEYKKKTSKMSKNNHLFVKTENTCNVFELQLNQNVPPKFTDGFLVAAKRLEDTFDRHAYLDFVNDFGTHYISKTHMGARYAVETEFDNTTRDELFHEDFDFTLGAKINFMVSLGLDVNIKKNKEIIDKYQELQKSHSILAYGSPIPKDSNSVKWANSVFENPLPINYQLARIQDLFTSRFMGNLEKFTLNYKSIYKQLTIFLKAYCKEEGNNIGIANCNGPNGGCGGGNDCHHNAECKDVPKGNGIFSYECKCKKGFQGNGRKCSGWHSWQEALAHDRYRSIKDSDVWGKWHKEELCPENTYAYQFAMKVHRHRGNGMFADDSALNGVKIYCKSKDGQQSGDVTSGMGGDGSWTDQQGCEKEKEFLVGYRFRSEVRSSNADDNWFGENIDIKCQKGDVLKGEDFVLDHGKLANDGQWSSWGSCKPGSAICGIKTKIYPKQSAGYDDVGLTDITFLCCKL